jgi:hypothetical protein
MSSLTAAVEGTVAQLRSALAGSGYRLDLPRMAYRPSEPAGLTQVPRAVLQVATADPESGFVLVYQLPDEEAAEVAARELASYLGSGFGKTNYPIDAQFSVAQVGSTVVFTWLSRERAGDPDAAQGAFDVVRSIGRQVPVQR